MVEDTVSDTLETITRWTYNLFDNRPLLLVRQTVAQSVPSGGVNTINFNFTAYDNYGGYDGTNTYTVQLAGMYRVAAEIQWTGNATQGRAIEIFQTGTPLLFPPTANDTATTAITSSMIPSTMLQCAVGDQMTVGGFQSTGAALNTQTATTGGIAYNSWFAMVWICS